jgi:hypothetical protein
LPEPATPGAELRTPAWLLRGPAAGNVVGVLALANGRLSFTGPRGTLFDASLPEVSEVSFPWYYFNGGLKLTVGGMHYRVSFLEPAGARSELVALLRHTD